MEARQKTEALVHEARRGDRDAFDHLARRYAPELEKTVRHRLGGYLREKVEVDDVVQETLLKAFASIASFEYRGDASVLAWLKRIAENLLLYWAREHRRTSQLPLIDSVAGRNTSPTKRLRREERLQRLELALSGLSDEQREVILLARVESVPIREIARRLGKKPDAVRQILWRSLQKLRASFGDTESLSLPSRELGRGPGPNGGCDVER